MKSIQQEFIFWYLSKKYKPTPQMESHEKIIPLFSQKENLSSDYQAFNVLIAQIADAKKRIQKVETITQQAKRKLATEINPFIEQLVEIKLNYIKLLDNALKKDYFSVWDRKAVKQLITNRSFELYYQYHSEEARQFYTQYKEQDPEQVINSIMGSLQDFVKDLYVRSSQSQQSHTEKNIHTRAENQSEEERQIPNLEFFRAEVEKGNSIQQLSRTLYAQLAKKLHPDTEQDEEKRQEKEELMKKLTEAYKKQDIFSLLQWQVMYLENTTLSEDTMNLEQVQILNNLLEKQLRQLRIHLHKITEVGEDGFIYKNFCVRDALYQKRFDEERNKIIAEFQKVKTEIEAFGNQRDFKRYLR